MNSTDELQRNPLAEQLMHAIENRSVEVVEVQNILLHQHHSTIDLSMIPILLLACELLNDILQHFVLLLCFTRIKQRIYAIVIYRPKRIYMFCVL